MPQGGLRKNTKILLAVAAAVVILALLIEKKFEGPTLHKEITAPAAIGNTTTQIGQNILLNNETAATASTTAVSTPETPVPKPLVTAEEYLVGDLDTGEIYIQHDPTTVYPIASISKLLAALVAIHDMDPNQEITITQPILDTPETAGELVLGEKLTPLELLDPLLLESSNDAAEALGQGFPAGYSTFIGDMNSFAAELGMTHTHFKDASGLSPENVSNANDLFVLAQYLYAHEQPLLAITRTVQITIASTSDHGPHTWNTINPFPLDPHFIGGKTGRTDEAKETMMSLFNYPSGGKTYHVAIIVLRSDFTQRQIDTVTLFEQAMGIIDKKQAATSTN